MRNYIIIIALLICLVLITMYLKNKKGVVDNFVTNPGFMNSLTLYNDIMKKLSDGKQISIEGPGSKKYLYVPLTTDLKTRLDLNYITDIIVKKLNKLGGGTFIFMKNGYDRIELIESGNKKNYIYEAFIYEYINATIMKLRINVVMTFRPREVADYRTCTEITEPEFKNYEIGIPSKDQLLPLPTEVIVTGRDILSTRGVRPIKRDDFETMHINYVEINNSTLVLHPFKPTMEVGGVNDSKLESSRIEFFDNGYIEPSIKRNKWPVIEGTKTDVFNWPCTKIDFAWDDAGLPPVQTPTKACPGLTYNVDPPVEAYEYWPNNVTTIPVRSGPNYWLFDLTRGIPSFPSSTSV